jgi:hypothetical protein
METHPISNGMDSRWITAVVAVIILALGAVYFLRSPQTPSTVTPTPDRALKTFYNQKYGIAFNYPDSYEVKETDATGEGTPRHSIVLADKAALASVPAESEGPPAITLDIFPNAQNQSPEVWIKGSNFSNFKLSPDGQISATAIAGEEGMAYGWDGLYRSNSIVINHKKQIYMFSVGYTTPDDLLIKDFAGIIASVQFDP